MNDNINHPVHYAGYPAGVECIDVTEHLSFCLGNAFKYVWRAGRKDQKTTVEDLEKALWYINRCIDRGSSYGENMAAAQAVFALIKADGEGPRMQILSLLLAPDIFGAAAEIDGWIKALGEQTEE